MAFPAHMGGTMRPVKAVKRRTSSSKFLAKAGTRAANLQVGLGDQQRGIPLEERSTSEARLSGTASLPNLQDFPTPGLATLTRTLLTFCAQLNCGLYRGLDRLAATVQIL